MNTLRAISAALLGTALLLFALATARRAPPPAVHRPPPRPAALFSTTERTVHPGDTLGGILAEQGAGRAAAIVDAAKAYADLTRIRPGRVFRFRRIGDELVSVAYQLDQDHTVMVWLSGGEPSAEMIEPAYQRVEAARSISIEHTLWASATAAGLRPSDVATLAGIFEYVFDFNTELRPGARLLVAGTDLVLDGRHVRPGSFEAVRLENGEQRFTAIHLARSGGDDGWYDSGGHPLKRAFLRSPLPFSRVSSGFSLRRFHPILKRSRPHLGVDFGAPTGTRVRATGDGVVRSAGRAGGYGKRIRIDHPGPYQTVYAHLSRILVKAGQRVHQGQVIGLVGATGLATGPHLHYEFRISGRPVDPLAVKLPMSQPLSKGERPAFDAAAAHWLPVLAALDAPAVADSEDARASPPEQVPRR